MMDMDITRLVEYFVRPGDSRRDVEKRMQKARKPQFPTHGLDKDWDKWVKRGKVFNWFDTCKVRFNDKYEPFNSGLEPVFLVDVYPSAIYDAGPGNLVLDETGWSPLSPYAYRASIPYVLESLDSLPLLLLQLAQSRNQVFPAKLEKVAQFARSLAPKGTPQNILETLPNPTELRGLKGHIFLFKEDMAGMISSSWTPRYEAPATINPFGVLLREVPYVLTF